MIVDPISDMLTRIRNASLARHKKVDVPCSRLKRKIAKIMEDHHYIKGFTIIEDGAQDVLRIFLQYDRGGASVFGGLRRISTSGLRMYVKRDEIPWVYNGNGMAIISTSRGLMSDRDARQQRLGGEVLCYIW
jgi:small subunit ribosomal protein S8